MEREKIEKTFLSIFKLDVIQELFYSGIGCIFFMIIIPFFPKKFWDEEYRTTLVLLILLSSLLVFTLINQVNSRKKFFNIDYNRNVILFSIINFGMLYFLFFRTSYGINGISGDNFYRSAYITQMAYSGFPQDFAYKNLSAFYSPLYWYLLALLARIFQINPFKMVKIGFLITFYIFPIIIYEIWKKIYDKKIAFIITILSFFVFYDLYSVDHLISFMLIIPFFMYYYENFKNKEFSKKDYIICGLFGSITFCTFFFYFLLIPIYYFISLIENKSEFKKNFRHILKVTIILLLFSSWFIIPLARDILFIGFESHQQNYFNVGILHLPIKDYFSFSIGGAIQFFGLLYIIKNYKTSKDLKILGNLTLSVYIMYIIGFIGLLLNNPLMHIRFLHISLYALIISSSIFYVKFFQYLIKNQIKLSNEKILRIKQIEIYILIFIIAFENYRIFYSMSISNSYDAANDEDYPKELIEIFEELEYEEKVFLTTKWRVAAYLPIYLFLLPNPYYSHPSALYNERVKFLVDLSECESSKKLHEKIIDNEFGPIDYFFLDSAENSTKLVFEVAVENFPDGRDYYDIEFDRELFEDEKFFKKIRVKGRIIYKTKY